MPVDEYREYRYRRLFGGSHADFLDEPAATVDWLLAIDGAVQKAENDDRSSPSSRPDANGVVTTPL